MTCQTHWNCSKRKFGLGYINLLCLPYNPAFIGNTPFSLPKLLIYHHICKISKHCVQAGAKLKLCKLIILHYFELTSCPIFPFSSGILLIQHNKDHQGRSNTVLTRTDHCSRGDIWPTTISFKWHWLLTRSAPKESQKLLWWLVPFTA